MPQSFHQRKALLESFFSFFCSSHIFDQQENFFSFKKFQNSSKMERKLCVLCLHCVHSKHRDLVKIKILQKPAINVIEELFKLQVIFCYIAKFTVQLNSYFIAQIDVNSPNFKFGPKKLCRSCELILQMGKQMKIDAWISNEFIGRGQAALEEGQKVLKEAEQDAVEDA